MQGRPNSYDRYGYATKEINNVFLKQLHDTKIVEVLQKYFNWFSEAKMEMEAIITFLPQVELGDVHRITQQTPSPSFGNQLIWNVGHLWNRGWVWGNRTGYLVYQLSCKVVGITIDLENFVVKLKYMEV
jgi:hypothetical protein